MPKSSGTRLNQLQSCPDARRARLPRQGPWRAARPCGVSLAADVHYIGRALGASYQIQVYDAMIVAAALSSGCTELASEDMQHGLLIERDLMIRNPFR